MSEARYEQVPLSSGKRVHVRVITLHPQDDEIKRLQECVSRMERFCASQQCALQGIPLEAPQEGQQSNPPVLSTLDADAVAKAIETLAELRKRADGHRRSLLKALLIGKQSEEDSNGIIESCTIDDIGLILLAATEPQLLPGVLKRLSSRPPAAPPTSGAPPAATS